MSTLAGALGRKFQLWRYSVSHSTLLLRSLYPEDHDTRLDLAFFGVRAMQLRDSYQAFSVAVLEAHEAGIYISQWMDEPLKCYQINQGPDYVLATCFSWHEDHGDHRTPSKFALP